MHPIIVCASYFLFLLTVNQVGYCENDVDCRRLLQLVHFGEKFDPGNCNKTCDNCCKMLTFVQKDVTGIAMQLVSFCLFSAFTLPISFFVKLLLYFWLLWF